MSMEIPRLGARGNNSNINNDQEGIVLVVNPMMGSKYDPDWKVAMSRKHAKKYFYNARTGVKSWTVPKDMDPVAAKASPPAKTPKKRPRRRKKRRAPSLKSKKQSFDSNDTSVEAGGLDASDDDEREIDQDTIRALKPPRNLRYMQLLLYFASLISALFALATITFAAWSLVDELNGPMGLLPSGLVYGIIGFSIFILFTSLAGLCGTKMKKKINGCNVLRVHILSYDMPSDRCCPHVYHVQGLFRCREAPVLRSKEK